VIKKTTPREKESKNQSKGSQREEKQRGKEDDNAAGG